MSGWLKYSSLITHVHAEIDGPDCTGAAVGTRYSKDAM